MVKVRVSNLNESCKTPNLVVFKVWLTLKSKKQLEQIFKKKKKKRHYQQGYLSKNIRRATQNWKVTRQKNKTENRLIQLQNRKIVVMMSKSVPSPNITACCAKVRINMAYVRQFTLCFSIEMLIQEQKSFVLSPAQAKTANGVWFQIKRKMVSHYFELMLLQGT